VNPDLRNREGSGKKQITDMAEIFGLPMATHTTGSQLHTWRIANGPHPSVIISRAKR
jgi:hypothetical protein